MNHGGGVLRIRTKEATDWKSGVQGIAVTVADTGKGIPLESISSIYKAFYTTKGAKGTGLGLRISTDIVHRHHGHLHMRTSQSSSSHGTVFQLFLPFQGAAGDASKS